MIVIIAMMDLYGQKQVGEERAYLTYTPHDSPSLKEVKQGRNLGAGADAEAMEECCLLTCYP